MGVALQCRGDVVLGPALADEPECVPALPLAGPPGFVSASGGLAHLGAIEVPSFQQAIALHVALPAPSY